MGGVRASVLGSAGYDVYFLKRWVAASAPSSDTGVDNVSGPPDEGSAGTEYAEHVQGILDRVAETKAQEEEQKRDLGRGPVLTRTPVVAIVVLLFGSVFMWNFQSMRSQAEPLPPEAVEASLQVSAMVMTSAIEGYRETNGRLPESLEELGMPPTVTQDIDYIPRGDQFDVVTSMNGTEVRFRSEDGLASLLQQMTTDRVVR